MAILNQFTLRRTSPRPSLLQPDPAPAPDTRRVPVVPLDVLVCTPDLQSETTQRFLKSLRDTTADIKYDLHVYDNRRRKPFVHAEAVNCALDMAEKAGHNLLICDDDIVFEDADWLDQALDHAELLGNDFGAMGFYLSYPNQGCWASAAWSGRNGLVALLDHEFVTPVCVPVQCSCCWLIAPTDLRWDERYNKYRVELPFAWALWERGKKFWSIPARIRHDCGTQFRATMTSQSERSAITTPDEQLYRREWLDTGRESALMDSIAQWMPGEILGHKEFQHHIRARNPKEESAVIQDKPERRALATVMVGKDSKRLLPLFRHAARRWNAELFVFDEAWMTDEPSPHFLKWKVNALFQMGYSRVCLIDGTDAVILPSCPDLFDIVPIGMLGAYDEAPLMELSIKTVYRKETCERFVQSFQTVEPGFKYQYPGYYFNSGVMVFDASCNPFVVRSDRKYSFNTDTLFDQTYLNVMAQNMPICWLDAAYNRMAIPQAHKYLGTSDMFADGAQILHYCGTVNEKRRMVEDLKSILPPAVERLPGPSLDGIYDFWRWAGKTLGVINSAVEIGSAHGESAWAATEMHPDMHLICVDPWESERYGDKAHSHFVARHGWNCNVEEYKGTSRDAAEWIPDGLESRDGERVIDVVYIDAMHEDPWITQDIETWLPKIRQGGIIGGHDYIFSVWPDVVRAVNAAFGGPDIVFQDTSWAVVVKQ